MITRSPISTLFPYTTLFRSFSTTSKRFITKLQFLAFVLRSLVFARGMKHVETSFTRTKIKVQRPKYKLFQQIWPVSLSLLQRLLAPPTCYLRMMAAEQNIWNAHPAKLRRACVVRISE